MLYNIVARSRGHCCDGNARVPSLCIVDVHYVAVNSVIYTESVPMETQRYVLCVVALHMSLPAV
jgi:hypothetical protein